MTLLTIRSAQCPDIAERRLWCRIIESAFRSGDRKFFAGSHFAQLAESMGLDVESITKRL